MHRPRGSCARLAGWIFAGYRDRSGNIGRLGDDGKRQAEDSFRRYRCSKQRPNKIQCLDCDRGSSADDLRDELCCASIDTARVPCRSDPSSQCNNLSQQRFQSTRIFINLNFVNFNWFFELTTPLANSIWTGGYFSSMSGATTSKKYLKGLQCNFSLIANCFEISPTSTREKRSGLRW